MCISRRSGRSSRRERWVMSRPLSRIVPDVGSSRRITQLPTVVLPLPDSPTSPSISPGASEKLTPSTACTVPPPAVNRPPAWKCFFRSMTWRSGSAAIPFTAWMEARDEMLRPNLPQLGHGRAREVVGARATVGEHTELGNHGEGGHAAWNLLQALAPVQPGARNGAEQTDRVRMLRVREQLVHRRLLDLAPCV